MFRQRSTRPERIDTGDHTPEEYRQFLREIRFINRHLGDKRALTRTLFRDVERSGVSRFSVVDVGAGSGELLRATAEFARWSGRETVLAGVDKSELSAAALERDCREYPEINCIRGDAFALPFEDESFDYAISSLFFHHLSDDEIPDVLGEMLRVARRGAIVIDLHRHRAAYHLFRLFCRAFGISRLVFEDGSLSILKGFRPDEMKSFSASADVIRVAPFRLAMTIRK